MDIKILMLIRFSLAALLILNVILVGLGFGFCISTVELEEFSVDNSKRHIAREGFSGCISNREKWYFIGYDYKDTGLKIIQFIVLIPTFLLAVAMSILSFVTVCDPPYQKNMVVSIIGIIVCSISFCLQAWSTGGAMTTKLGKKYFFYDHLGWYKLFEKKSYYPDELRPKERDYYETFIHSHQVDTERTVYTSYYIQSWAAATVFYFVLTVLFAVDSYFADQMTEPSIQQAQFFGKASDVPYASPDLRNIPLDATNVANAPPPPAVLKIPSDKQTDSNKSKKSIRTPTASNVADAPPKLNIPPGSQVKKNIASILVPNRRYRKMNRSPICDKIKGY